ncbi:MAG: hypothetical protein OER96_12680 [Gammaproteobacteria bacterium]|nr:hypothetical protein [Gammaproteobacteria bacterium]
MTNQSGNKTVKTPWHLWAIGIVALLWSCMGAFDYLMTQTKNESYMSHFTPEQLEFFYSFPAWLVTFWAVAVWGGVIGAVLLLMRKRLSVWLFLASLISMVITTIHNYGFSNGMEIIGDAFSLIFTAVIFVLALLFFVYSRAMRKRNLLT